MPQPISPKPKTRFKYYREVRNTWLGVCLVGLTFSLAYPRVIEPRLNSGEVDTPITSTVRILDQDRSVTSAYLAAARTPAPAPDLSQGQAVSLAVVVRARGILSASQQVVVTPAKDREPAVYSDPRALTVRPTSCFIH